MGSDIETGIDAFALTNPPDGDSRLGSLRRSQNEFYEPSATPVTVSGSGSIVPDGDKIPISPPTPESQSESGGSRLVEGLVERIEAAAEAIHSQLSRDRDAALHETIEDWSALHGIEPDQSYEVAARHAACQLVLKAALYERSGLGYGPLESADDIWDVFDVVAAEIGIPAVGENALDDVARVVEEPVIVDLVLFRHVLLYSRKPADDIGWLYAQITPNENRQTLGQFRTPPAYSAAMYGWVSSANDTILDPGVGAGPLTTTTTRSSVETVYGIDRSPLSIVMAATAATCRDQSITLHEADFFEADPANFESDLGVICNPPYTRASQIPSEYRERLNRRIEERTGRTVSLKSPLYVYFIMHAGQFLSPGDRGAFITPTQFLTTEYGTALKQYLLDEFEIHALVELDLDEPVFEDATTTGLLSFVEKSGATDSSDAADSERPLRCIRVTDWPGAEALLRAVTDEGEDDPEWGDIYRVSQDSLDPTENWATCFDSIAIDTSHLTPLSNLATVRSGPSTGANEFFCLSESDVTDWQIERDYRVPVIRNAARIPNYDYRTDDFERQRANDKDVWLLSQFDDADVITEITTTIENGLVDGTPPSQHRSTVPTGQESDVPQVAHYLAYGTDNGVHTRYDPNRRNPWFDVAPPSPAPILALSASRGEYRFVKNEAEAHHLNTLYGIYPDQLDEREEDALLGYLNSGVCSEIIRHHTRELGDGLTKLRVTTLKTLPVLDPRTIDDETVEALASAFDSLRDAARRDDRTDAIRDELTRLVKECL